MALEAPSSEKAPSLPVRNVKISLQLLLATCIVVTSLCLCYRPAWQYAAARYDVARLYQTFEGRDYIDFVTRQIPKEAFSENGLRSALSGLLDDARVVEPIFLFCPVQARFYLNDVRAFIEEDNAVSLFRADRVEASGYDEAASGNSIAMSKCCKRTATGLSALRANIRRISATKYIHRVWATVDSDDERLRECLKSPRHYPGRRDGPGDFTVYSIGSSAPGRELRLRVWASTTNRKGRPDLRVEPLGVIGGTIRQVFLNTAIPYSHPDQPLASTFLQTEGDSEPITRGSEGLFAATYPRLNAIWSFVYDIEVAKAESFLLQKEHETERQVTILGISIDETSVTFLAPIIILGLVLSCHGNLKHIERDVIENGEAWPHDLVFWGGANQRWRGIAQAVLFLPFITELLLGYAIIKRMAIHTVATACDWSQGISMSQSSASAYLQRFLDFIACNLEKLGNPLLVVVWGVCTLFTLLALLECRGVLRHLQAAYCRDKC